MNDTLGRINGSLGEPGWVPIHYVTSSYPRSVLAGLYRLAKVGLVTPIRDGMNLVAKEYVAAQDPADPGVLILSKFAGAAQQLTDALIVNPNDKFEVAEAINTALHMSLDERIQRWSEHDENPEGAGRRMVGVVLSERAEGPRSRGRRLRKPVGVRPMPVDSASWPILGHCRVAHAVGATDQFSGMP